MQMPSSTRIPTNLRTLLIMEIFANSGIPMSSRDVHKEIDLPYQTVHRLLSALENEGFLVREVSGKKFRTTRRLRNMATGLMHVSHLNISRHQILREVASKTGETVNFVVPHDNGMHYLDRVETDWAFRVQLPRGSSVPFHCTASGKIFMSSLANSVRLRFVSALQLSFHTSNTIVDKDELLREIAATKKRGYAIDKEEFMAGMVAISVPVVDEKGRFVAALATHGPLSRMPLVKLLEYRPILAEGANKISEAIF
mgnify:CR=1 FL=1